MKIKTTKQQIPELRSYLLRRPLHNHVLPRPETKERATIDCMRHAATKLPSIFSRQASLARQAFLITPLHGARYKTGKNAYAKK